MPEKSVREMSELERKHYSLSGHVFRSTLVGVIILGLVAFVIGLSLYTYALVGQYIGESFGLAKSAALVVNAVMDTKSMSDQVMTTYRSLTQEELAQTGTESYRARFAQVKNDENFDYLVEILREFLKTSDDVSDLYLGMYDRETSALVYIADPDQSEMVCEPGDWESVETKEMERFLSWNGEGQLYDIGNTDKYGWLCTAGVPLKDSEGNVIAFLLADVGLEEVLQGMKNFALQYTIAMIVSVIVYTYFTLRHTKKTLVEPINAIASAAEAYMADKSTDGEKPIDRFASLNIRTGDEIENLSLVMADMEKDLVNYVQNLTEVTAEKERINTELTLANGIQANVLPNTFPAFPEREEFEVYATMDPAKEVGGDFYDFFMIDEDHLVMVMADVSGKGIPAALFMMTARTMLKDAALAGLDPASVMERVNAQLSENNDYMMFVTVWLGILEISTGKLIHADAGHEQLMVYHEGAWKFLERGGGVALAAFDPEMLALEDEPAFKNRELMLEPGDMIFQYTDGVTEAMTIDRQQFGMNRVLEVAKDAGPADPTKLLPFVREKIDEFVQDAPQFDDITMLALKYKGPIK